MEPKIKALLDQINSGKIKTDAAKILNFIIDRSEANAVHMESLLPMFNKTLSARLSELQDTGVIYVSGTFANGKHSIYKHEADEEKQKINRCIRKAKKFNIWVNKGLNYFGEMIEDETVEQLKKLQ